jgi:DNA-binding Lrp family transcriptional regulator
LDKTVAGLALKDIELRLIAELMKNSARSDRELARALGVSQPTVSRTKSRLEKEGYIMEYTIVPNFNKIGYHIFALTFFRLKKDIPPDEMHKAVKLGLEKSLQAPPNVVVIERGIGLHSESFMASFHKDYASYTKLMQGVKTSQYLDASTVENFMVDLDDKVHYRYLTLSTLAKHMLEIEDNKDM